jgi:hypothetical protein
MSVSDGRTSRSCITYAQPDDTHDDHGDDVENRAFEPLAKARSSIKVLVAISCSLLSRRLATSREESLLLRRRRIAAANRRSGISISSLWFPVEGRHFGRFASSLSRLGISLANRVVAA